MTMGEKILNMRKARGWNQEELAERVGVTRQAVSRWESGTAKPDADKIISICDLFGVSADYLLRDQFSGEGSAAVTGTRPVTALEAKAQSLTGKQWSALCSAIAGGLVLFILKLIYIFKDTNYSYHSGYAHYQGFQAFLRMEELFFIWLIAMLACVGGLAFLLVWPIIRKDKERNPWPWERESW